MHRTLSCWMRPYKEYRLLLCVLLLGIWSGPGFAQTSTDRTGLQDVRVQLKWTHQFQFAGYYAAIHKGYYRDAGLNVRLIEHTGGVTPIDQLIGGRVDYAVADSGALIYRSAGVPLVTLAAIFQESPSILITLESSGIRELADLRGKRAMLLGGYLNAELMSMLQTVGITGDDIRLVPGNTSIQALVDGQTDAYNAYTTNEPYALAQKGIAFRSFSPHEYGVNFYGDILITTEAKIKTDPEQVDRFLSATIEGWRYAVEHPEEIVELILSDYNSQERTRDHLLFEATEAIRLILPDVVPIGYMNQERWKRIEHIFRTQGQLSQAVDMTRFIHRREEPENLVAVVMRYRLEIAAGIVLLTGLGLLVHILRLRTQVRTRTCELEEAKSRAEVEARTDPLTGLPNRRYFLETLMRDVARSERIGMPLSILSLDIDFFKAINDRYGHAAGDEALQSIARTLARQVRSGDIAARIGGEEFALSFINIDIEETRMLAERLRAEIESATIEYGEEFFGITCSIGIATREEGDDVEGLLRKSDLALYEAKQGGRNRVCEWHIHCHTPHGA